jgi:chromosome partitioning protein
MIFGLFHVKHGEPMARIIAVANQKGGVGKTTTTVNLASSVAVAEQRTLIVDLDPQANATSGVGASRSCARHVYHALLGFTDSKEVILETEVPYLSIMPSGPDLAGAEIELVSTLARESKLTKTLASLQNEFDYIFIDCPPSLGLLTLNALVAADSVLVPVQSEYFALEGLSELLRTISMVRDQLNPRLDLEGILMTMVDTRTSLAREVVNEVRGHFPDATFDTIIPRNIKLSEAPSHGKPILLYDIASKGAQAYLSLAAEVINNSAGRGTV